MCADAILRTKGRADYLQSNVELHWLLLPSQQLSQGRCVGLLGDILLANQGVMHCRQ
jgi:hypothetical protein